MYVRGAAHFSPDEITQVFAGLLNLSGAGVFGATLVPALTREIREERETELMRMYSEEGFFEASARSREKKDPDLRVIDLYVDVEEGPRYSVTFTGNQAIPALLARRLGRGRGCAHGFPPAGRPAGGPGLFSGCCAAKGKRRKEFKGQASDNGRRCALRA